MTATALDLSQIRTDALDSDSTFRALIGVYSEAEVDGIIAGLSALQAEDIDTLAEINAILTDASLASVAYVDGLASNYATASQGAKADTAIQPTDITSGTITSGTGDIDFDALGGLANISDTATGVQVDGFAVIGKTTNSYSSLSMIRNNVVVGGFNTAFSKVNVFGGPIDSVTHMTITSSGNVGINNVSPISKLHVYQNDAVVSGAIGLTIEQNGTGDAAFQFLITGVTRWVVGVDNSDGDSFKISPTVDVGAGSVLTIATNGETTINGSLLQSSSTSTSSATVSMLDRSWVDSTHATRKGQVEEKVYDTAARTVARSFANGTNGYKSLKVVATAPADADIANGEVVFYTDGSGNLAIKLKDSGGTVRTGTVTLS